MSVDAARETIDYRLYIYIYTSVDPCIYMHGVLGARVLGFRVLWDSSFILLPCASSSFLESSRVVSINLEAQEDPGRSSGGPSPHNIHARGIRGASPRVSSFDRLELHLIRAFRRARSDR